MTEAILAKRRQLPVAALLCSALLLGLHSASASGAEPARRPSIARTSRWWRLTCDAAKPEPCVLVVRLRGPIDRSRQRLVEEALRRGNADARTLGRRVVLRVDADTRGGEVFAAMEIGRLLRRESASIQVGPRAECVSACIFVLMGATERSVAPDARIGIHRPSLGHAAEDSVIDSMAAQIVHYAEQMRVPRKIVDDMMAIPASRIRYLTVADLAGYGITINQ
jgi:membrane-bound ClpP family serine protease